MFYAFTFSNAALLAIEVMTKILRIIQPPAAYSV